jgi:hypothetical protein
MPTTTNHAIDWDLANALQSYLSGISPINSVPIFAMQTAKALDGSFLSIMPEAADWYTLGGFNASTIVDFQFSTQASDPDLRVQVDDDHAARVGALVDLFSLQRFTAVLAQLNFYGSNPFLDTRPWKGLGFDTWEEDSRSESHTDTQIVTSLKYEFVVHFEV